MKTILVTGATGYLGHYVVLELLKNAEFHVLAIGGRPQDKTNPLPANPRLSVYLLDDLFTRDFGKIDTVINCAFARSNDPVLLAEAIDFTTRAINRFVDIGIGSLINISTQGVYERLETGIFSNEDSPIRPIDLYSMVKYSVEKLFEVSSIPFVTNVRLASLMMPQRFLYFFVKKAVEGEHFSVTAPDQQASLLDVTDAASGLVALAALKPSSRDKLYNLGIGRQYSILDYAESVKRIGEQMGHHVDFDVVHNDTANNSGMDCARLMSDTGWRPKILKDEMIYNLFMTFKTK